MHTKHLKVEATSSKTPCLKFDDTRFIRIHLCVYYSGFAASVLQKAQVRIINHTVCNKLMDGQITSRMLCAGVLSGGVDACQVINRL